MVGGRPRTTSFSPEEMILLGEEMVQWVKTNQKSILHLSEWYTIEKGFIYNEWKQFITKEEFHPYYEQALKIVGKKYLDKTSNVRDSISHRWQRTYFKDLKQEENEEAEFKAELNKKTEAGTPPLQDNINSDHENMKLKAELAEAKAKLEALGYNANLSETR